MPDTRRKRRAFGVTPLTPLLKPKNHFSQICKYSFAPLGGTHGEFFSFFKWGIRQKIIMPGGVRKKERHFRRLSGHSDFFFLISKQNLVAKSSEKKLKLHSDSPVSQLSYGGSNFSVASKLWELKMFCPGVFLFHALFIGKITQTTIF